MGHREKLLRFTTCCPEDLSNKCKVSSDITSQIRLNLGNKAIQSGNVDWKAYTVIYLLSFNSL